MSGGGGRLLFDECLPRPFVARLAVFLSEDQNKRIIFQSLFDLAPSGTRDEDWIPLIQDQGWTVISADGAKRPNKGRGKRLPDLCVEFGVTLIVLSARVHGRKVIEKTWTIVSVWDQIVEIANDPATRGCRYLLEPLIGDDDPERGRIVSRPDRRKGPQPSTRFDD